MAVFRWGHSWDAFHDLEREVDRLLQSVNLTFQGLRFGRQYPPVNLYELPEEYLIIAQFFSCVVAADTGFAAIRQVQAQRKVRSWWLPAGWIILS